MMSREKVAGISVLGAPLERCSTDPLTGFWRDGCCNTGPADRGRHTVCAVMTASFLTFSRAAGNDLITARPEFGFPGLKPGDRWCLCVDRWAEADDAGCAPPVVLQSTHAASLKRVSLDRLRAHAYLD
ncbi:MAG: DUF2237 domain-containing protein [Pseudomonadota bacterium]